MGERMLGGAGADGLGRRPAGACAAARCRWGGDLSPGRASFTGRVEGSDDTAPLPSPLASRARSSLSREDHRDGSGAPGRRPLGEVDSRWEGCIGFVTSVPGDASSAGTVRR